MNTATKRVPSETPSSTSLTIEQWLDTAERNLLNGIIANISPADGKPGAVIASPSRANPDYYYHWIRDSARTMGEIVRLCEQNVFGMRDHYEQLLCDYIDFSVMNQRTPNPSGHVGEPKFYPNGEAFQGEWGRPQNDGPAQRALTLTRWAQYLCKRGLEDDVGALFCAKGSGLIKTDLEYTANHWQDSCFDVWEEVEGQHLYTRIIQHVALREGAELAVTLGDTAAATFYRQQADAIEARMSDFWSEDKGYYLATLHRKGGLDYKSSGLDIAALLGVFQAQSAVVSKLSAIDERVLSTAYALYQAFDTIFPVNDTRMSPAGDTLAPGIGRYPEDRYSGTEGVETGNPWFLCTGTMAGICYQAALLFSKQGAVTVTSRNIRFLRLALSYGSSSVTVCDGEVWVKSSESFDEVVHGLIALGDACLRRIQLHSGNDDVMSEQFHHLTGEMLSADHLTWSYVNVLSCIGLRKQLEKKQVVDKLPD